MRNIIEYSDLIENESFVLWYLIQGFPIGLTENEDALCEITEENYGEAIDIDMIDDLTGYYEGVLEKSDGYIDNPKTIKLELAEGNTLFIEFHPGDTLYYLNEDFLGCTGPHYEIWKIPFEKFLNFTAGLNDLEKLLVLPMVKISEDESEKFYDIVVPILKSINIDESDIEDICTCIVSNCLPE